MARGHVAKVSSTTTSTAQADASTTAAPTQLWTMDAAIVWVVAAFYFAVMAAAAVYFLNRWRKRAYGPSSPAARGSGAGGDAGFIATIGAIIDRVMNRAALDGAAAWQDSGRHRGSSSNSRHKPGASTNFLRRIAPYLSGAQGRPATARRTKEKDEATEEVVEVDAATAGSPSTRYAGTNASAPIGGVGAGEGGSGVPSSGFPSTMTAREPAH